MTAPPQGWRRVDPPSRPVLFVNPRSGGGKASRAALAENARDRGIRCVVLEPGAGARGARARGGRRRRRHARHGRRRRLARRGGCGRERPRVAVRLRPRRNAQPLRPRPRSGARDISARSRLHGRPRTPHRRRRGQRPPLPQQRLVGIYGDAVQRPATATPSCGCCWRRRAQVLGPSGGSGASDRRRPRTRAQRAGGRARLEQPVRGRAAGAPGTRLRLDTRASRHRR